MSNEMISVPRELLEEILQAMQPIYSLPPKYYGSTLGERVRALLDKPAEQPRGNVVAARVCAYTPGLGQVELKLPGALPSWLELGEVVTVQQGGAQPQGNKP